MDIVVCYVTEGQRSYKLSEVLLHGIGYHGNAPTVKNVGAMNLKIKKSGNY